MVGFLTFAYFALFWLSLPVLAWVARRWGSPLQQRVLMVYLIACALTVMFREPRAMRYVAVEWRVFAVDAIATLLLAFLAIRSGKLWAIWLTAFQGMTTLSHLMRLADPSLFRMAYAMLASAPSYGVLITLALAVRREALKTRTPVADT